MALQIALATGTFEASTYKLANRYDGTTWIRVPDDSSP